MTILTKKQKSHVAKTISSKRKEKFGYRGGNRELAEKLGVSEQLVSMWACNKRVPRDRELLALSEVLDIPFAELCFAGDKHPKAAQKAKKPEVDAIQDDARRSMLEICDITTQLVKYQKKMLTGKRNAKKHKEWLKRIKHYVDAL